MPKSIEEMMNLPDDEMLSRSESMVFGDEAPQDEEEENQEADDEAEDTSDEDTEDTEEDSEGETEEDSEDGTDDSDDGDSDDSGSDDAETGDEDGDKENQDQGEPRKKGTLKVKPSKKEADGGEQDQSKQDGQSDAPLDYKALYDEIMKPFKANGREVKLNTPDEVVKLMQMGANYTKKMQALQPNLKILRMLENNQLLDENKLSELIDVAKGNKGAITKYLKSSGLDPMDIDTENDVNYIPGNHRVSDAAINFDQALEETASTEHGQDLIISIDKQWDRTSKQELHKDPGIIHVLTEQKAAGIYDQIVAEVERQKMLGHPQLANMPFIHAYKEVGQYMSQNGLLRLPEDENTSSPRAQPKKVPVAKTTAPAAKRSSVSNGAKAKAASPSGNTSKKAQQAFNPLAMSDEEFLEQMKNRV